MSQRCELDTSERMPSEHPDRDASVHQEPQGSRQRTTVLMRQRLGHNHDSRNTLDARRRYDSGEDRSPSPDLPRP